MGGENHPCRRTTRRGSGSSPRGRGKLSRNARDQLPRRLIPAWAGKTRGSSGRSGQPGAHPRVGGENPQRNVSQTCENGSSPRGRGKPGGRAYLAGQPRLIPAWAGKTLKTWTAVGRTTAHPRVGGENSILSPALDRRAGSSPRGRGKLGVRRLLCCQLRLIPAWAGKTPKSGRPPFWRTAHPRVGGENRADENLMDLVDGSSPRGRGKPHGVLAHGPRTRLIPAWAGKTWRAGLLLSTWPAHPRVGGENTF